MLENVQLLTLRDSQLRACTSQDLVGQSDKREESTVQQCKRIGFISEAKLLGRYFL